MSDKLDGNDEFDLIDLPLDRSAVRVFHSHAEAEAADREFWFARTPHERLLHMERLRRMNYGGKATARLQRVLEFATCK